MVRAAASEAAMAAATNELPRSPAFRLLLVAASRKNLPPGGDPRARRLHGRRPTWGATFDYTIRVGIEVNLFVFNLQGKFATDSSSDRSPNEFDGFHVEETFGA
jgi:hypothetical protein